VEKTNPLERATRREQPRDGERAMCTEKRMKETEERRDWIVLAGQPVDTTSGGGYEFFGPFTEDEARRRREQILSKLSKRAGYDQIVLMVQLLH
jgi:hypothetical protein